MGGKWTKQIPKCVWMIGTDKDEWKQGPYVNKPPGESNRIRKFKLVEVTDEKDINS